MGVGTDDKDWLVQYQNTPPYISTQWYPSLIHQPGVLPTVPLPLLLFPVNMRASPEVSRPSDSPVFPTQVDYIWETSIPQSWVRLKGKDHFRHAQQTSVAPSAIDFLKRTQQYMSVFTQPAKSQSPRCSKQQRTMERSHSDFESPKGAHLREIQLAMLGRSDPPRFDSRTESLPVMPPSWKQSLPLTSSVKQDFRNHIITRLSLPRSIRGEKSRISMGPSNRSVEKFLHRFEEQRKQVRPKTMRRGFAAQKLPATIPRMMQHKTRSWDQPDIRLGFTSSKF